MLRLGVLVFALVSAMRSSAAPWSWPDEAAAAWASDDGWARGGGRHLRGADEPTQYGGGPLLVPLLPYGLSNQIVALKEALALAAVLNWTVVGYGFMPHYSEYAEAAAAAAAGGASGAEPAAAQGAVPFTAIPFDALIDRASLAPLVRIVTVQEAVAMLWREKEHQGDELGKTGRRNRRPQRRLSSSSSSGRSSTTVLPRSSCNSSGSGGSSTGGYCLPVDHIVLLRDNGMPETLHKAEAAGGLDASVAHTVRKKFSCDARGLDWFRKTAARDRWRVAALNGYRCVLPQARSGFASMQARAGGDGGCWRAYQRVTALMQRSEAVRDAAAAFLDSAAARALTPGDDTDGSARSGGGGSGGAVAAPLSPRVLALHFRPYPDTCLDYFVNMTTFDLGVAQEVCSQPLLLHRTVPLVQAFLALWAAEAAEAEAEGANAAARGPAVVFVMSHPRVRKTVSREFERLWATGGTAAAAEEEGAEEGTSPGGRKRDRKEARTGRDGGRALQLSELAPLPRLSFLDLDDVPPALFEAPGNGGRGSSSGGRALPVGANSILSVVEQQVCADADVFIGTAASSISVLVSQERVVRREPGTRAGAELVGEEEGGEAREEKEEWVKQAVAAATEGEGAQGFHVASDGRVTILL